MDRLRGVAHQHRAFAGQRLGFDLDGRVETAGAAFQEPSHAPSERGLCTRQERGIVQRGHRGGLVCGHAEHQPVVAVAARQQCRRAARSEALEGRAFGCALGAQPADEECLPVIVSHVSDAQRAPHAAIGAISPDQQARAQVERLATPRHLYVAQWRPAAGHDRRRLEPRRAISDDARELGHTRFQRLAEVARHDHAPEFLAPVPAGVQQDPSEIALAGDMDAPDRTGRRAQLLHHPQRGQGVHRRLGETEVALVEHGRQRPGRGRFDQSDVHAIQCQRDCQAAAHQAAADDQDVVRAGVVVGAGRGCERRRREGRTGHCAMLPGLSARPSAC